MKELSHCSSAIFTIEGKYYAYDWLNFRIETLTKSEYDLFIYMREHKKLPKNTSADIIFKILKWIKQGLFFQANEIEIVETPADHPELIISFPIIYECNYKCKYCFEKTRDSYQENREISQETICNIINFIKQLNISAPDIRLEFVSGAEPLLKPALFFDILEYAYTELKKIAHRIKIFLVTNASTLDESIIIRLNRIGVAIGVSLDGPLEIHNFQRPMKNGSNSYDLTIKGIKLLQKHNKILDNIWTISVITQKSPPLEKILEHNKGIGIKSMEMRIMRGNEPKELCIGEESLTFYIELYTNFANYLKKNPLDILNIANEYDTFGKIIKRIITCRGIIHRCTAGYSKFSFTSNGDIYPCDSFASANSFIIGNVNEGYYDVSVSEMFFGLQVAKLHPCSTCDYKVLCGGECNYNVYEFNKTLNERSTIFCRLQSHLCQLAIALIDYIRKNATEDYVYIERYLSFHDKISRTSAKIN